ncbi:MAG: hypothetical protein MRECE_2c026 [Mycoplasmataceae bacterium CE_OT135]|nr:MAG: hypothetical protein MRECE_2c026 [Mycoplasmataceae bacterium CE_OT135]
MKKACWAPGLNLIAQTSSFRFAFTLVVSLFMLLPIHKN